MKEFGNIGREMPYTLPEGSMERLRERILSRTAQRPKPARASRLYRVCLAGAGAALIAGLVLGIQRKHNPADSRTDLDALLSSVSAETLRQAAAQNYDDILYEQQL